MTVADPQTEYDDVARGELTKDHSARLGELFVGDVLQGLRDVS
jgi:hypothetical protein